MLRDILKGEAQAEAAAQVILRSAPDILLLTQFDYDHGHIAALAFRDRLAAAGLHYPYLVTLRPNTGRPTGLDLDGDGRLDEPEDAHGYGVFSGQGGMVILSRLPVQRDAVRDFPTLLWKDLPGQTMPTWMPTWTAKGAADVLRLSSVGHWVVPIETPSGPLTLLAFHAQTPVFDGPEDRNGHRNHNEILFWRQFLDGHFGPAPDARFALLGTINLDPVDGEGQHGAINSLLSDPRFQDPAPRSAGGAAAGSEDQSGDPALDTVDWKEPVPGNLRVDYVLPSSDLRVLASGVDWPAPQDAGLEVVERASVHRLVWVDVDIGGS